MAATKSGEQQPILNNEVELRKLLRPVDFAPLTDILEVPGVFEFVRVHNRSCGHGFDWQERQKTVKVCCCRCKEEFEEVRKPLHEMVGRHVGDGAQC